MEGMLKVATIIGALMLTGGISAADSGFRCEGGRLVTAGDHMHEVKKRCGDPDLVGTRTEKRRQKYKVRRWVSGTMEEVSEEREVEVTIDEWTYDLGPERFIRHVSFENQRVTLVTTGDYGTKAR